MCSHLFDRKQCVLVDGQTATETSLDFGKEHHLQTLTEKHSICHETLVDDTQQQDYLQDKGLWMGDNKFKLKSNKTEDIRF